MNRRELLKAAAAAGVSLAALSVGPRGGLTAARDVEAAALGRVLRGTHDGRLLESLDGGASWQVVANFGAACAIVRIAERGGRATVTAAVGSHTFDLHSSDARTWRTRGALEGRAGIRV
jgi:uncharacterized protein (DUF1501 family)